MVQLHKVQYKLLQPHEMYGIVQQVVQGRQRMLIYTKFISIYCCSSSRKQADNPGTFNCSCEVYFVVTLSTEVVTTVAAFERLDMKLDISWKSSAKSEMGEEPSPPNNLQSLQSNTLQRVPGG